MTPFCLRGCAMIRNINFLTFREFGSVASEHPAKEQSTAPERTALNLRSADAIVYRAESETYLSAGIGMTVLSVSNDGEQFLHFYLDKTVCIRSGVYFCLSPFQQPSSGAYLSAAVPPYSTETYQQICDFRLQRKVEVTGLYTFFYQEKENGFVFPGEAHPMLELTYVDQGQLHSVADGLELLLQQGELTVYGPNQWHMQYADIGVAPRFVTISFDVQGAVPEALLNRKFCATQQVTTLLQKLLREQERMDAFSADMMLALLSELILTILRHADAPTDRVKASNSVHSENEIIRRAQQYISTHIRDKLSVPHVASIVDVSPSYLTALFHKNLQISPGEYIRRLKLQESKQMIRENSMTFTQIAAALHYSTVHHFSRQFKEKFGITPSEYARSVR